MNNRSYCYPREQARLINRNGVRILLLGAALCLLSAPRLAQAGDAPAWMHAVATATLPAHDEKTDAVLLYEERTVNVQSADKIKTQVRVVYKILRPSGRDYGFAAVPFNAHSKVNGLRGWCIPAQGKDYEVRTKKPSRSHFPR